MSAVWWMLHRWQNGTSLPYSIPKKHIFQKGIKPWKPHTHCMIYKYITAQNMAKWITINISKSHGDLSHPIPLPKVLNVCSVLWFFFFFFVLCSWFASVHFLFRYSTKYVSNFICDLTRTYQSIQDRNGRPLKLLGFEKLCLLNKHFPFLPIIATIPFAIYAEIAKEKLKKLSKLFTLMIILYH